MEFIQTKNYGTPMTVVFTGEKYFFNDNLFGLVAIATRRLSGDPEPGMQCFDVVRCQRMNPATLIRIIKKTANRYSDVYIEFNTNEYVSGESLPYKLEMRAVAR